MSTPARSGGRGRGFPRAALLASLALVVAACDDGTFAGRAGPTEVTVGSAIGNGSVGTLGTSGAALVGAWTRVDATSAGVLTQTEWVFGADGSAARVVTTRTALGAVLAVDRQAGTWRGGGGLVLITFAGTATTPTVTLHATFAVQVGLSGTTLQLDGIPYRRSS